MSKEFPELDETRVSVDETTRQRHLAAIATALHQQRGSVFRRGRVLAIALALVLLVPVVALASENAAPGDFLYPVKRAVEPVVGIFDSDVVAEHRVEEVETLYQRDAPPDVIHNHVERARDVVTDHHPHLSDRIDRVVTDLEQRLTDEADHSDPAPGDQDATGGEHPDRHGGSGVDHATTTTVKNTTDSIRPHDRAGDG